ncbi:MAG: PP2C family protein-serine/threonine phosphatase [Acidobacteriota bacterium]
MKRFSPYAAFLLGVLALALLLPRFNASQPVGVRVSRSSAIRIANAEATKLGIPVDKSWSAVSWLGSGLLDKELEGNDSRRRAAALDPVIGPRLGGYAVTYYRRGLEKFQPYGRVYVSAQTGQVLAARRRLRTENAGAQLTSADSLRAQADAFVKSRQIPGAPSVVFEAVRPTVLTQRTDWTFRFRVPSKFPIGNVVPYLWVYFSGDQFTGWDLIEEYSDGRQFRGENASDVAGMFVQFCAIFVVLLVLLLIFLRKYHAGEVGVRTGAMLFALTILIAFIGDLLIAPGSSESVGMGGLDAQQTSWVWLGFKFLFYDIPLAVIVFLGWSVGESYARERWGERLASFDAILRRDPINATVGRSILNGILTSPVVAATAQASALIPIALNLAHPALGASRDILASPAGTMLFGAALNAIVISTAAVLFVLAYSHSRRALPIGIIAALAIGTIMNVIELPIGPALQNTIFCGGAVAAIVVIFLRFDLLTSAVSLFFGGVLLTYLPLLTNVRGDVAREIALTAGIPIVVITVAALAGIWTGREIIYRYLDLAPHVKRIIERERVKAEIDAANRIQAALLPLDPPALNGATVASHYRAATEIGGDYFDFLALPTGEIGVAFGDVSGHGLTSGIVMAMAKAALLIQVDVNPSPQAVLTALNGIVMKTAPKRMLMTFFFGVLDARLHQLCFASAGHLDPYVYRAAERRIESLSSWGFPLGVNRREPFREHSVDFAVGDRLILYSDGLIEALDDDGEPFGFVRFEETLLSCGGQSADDIKKTLLQSIRKFTRNRPPEDDQTLVVISFDQPVGSSLQAPVVTEYAEHVN